MCLIRKVVFEQKKKYFVCKYKKMEEVKFINSIFEGICKLES